MHCCETMEYYLDQEDQVVRYLPHFREYGVPVHDGGSSHIVIEYCCWCGARLPSSLRYEWFDIIDSMGLELGDPGIPENMLSDIWWKQRYGADAAPQAAKPNAGRKTDQGEKNLGSKRMLCFDLRDEDTYDGGGG